MRLSPSRSVMANKGDVDTCMKDYIECGSIECKMEGMPLELLMAEQLQRLIVVTL